MTDVRDRDPKIRELVLRIVDAAPEPAPFPIGATPPRAPRRRGRVLVAAACVVVLAVVGVVLATKSSPDKKPRVSTSETTTPDVLHGKPLPKQGIAVLDGKRATLHRDDGSVIATVPFAEPTHGTGWDVQLFVTRTGVR